MIIVPLWMDALLSGYSKHFNFKCRWMLNVIFRACCLILFWNQDVKWKYICPWTAALAWQLEVVFMGNGRSSGIKVPAVCVFTEYSAQRLLGFGDWVERWLGISDGLAGRMRQTQGHPSDLTRSSPPGEEAKTDWKHSQTRTGACTSFHLHACSVHGDQSSV